LSFSDDVVIKKFLGLGLGLFCFPFRLCRNPRRVCRNLRLSFGPRCGLGLCLRRRVGVDLPPRRGYLDLDRGQLGHRRRRLLALRERGHQLVPVGCLDAGALQVPSDPDIRHGRAVLRCAARLRFRDFIDQANQSVLLPI
jgi:hypothetical protein